ncbi:ubiquitin carboxyl-terminal hydrolase [Aspergillus aculeatinus CBS 121060]|uniref:Ubiquitin carboxyl-terminal hydrolase n=1 Tax=Aspergillus aculeatinus CBS 121060 TaxID=1448322 RepID=A0ACD1H5F5_9EURO|nr:ubiquitin carboxyl-terminal hydrolase [Aspergillus aculeatinus CBS 121060]RAH68847.1 ubiquitin carboxyl-terminal hydrolase [Aspergillus aculeatinus CBS 121060]
MEKKTWSMLENSPDVMNQMAAKLGLSPELQFYDIYSLDEPEQLAHIPRPALALLVIIPLTPAWDRSRKAEDANTEPYTGSGPDEPVICDAIPLDMTHRAEMLCNSEPFELAHKSVEQAGDSCADPTDGRSGGHFVGFVKSGGKLWELEGSRKGPLERGSLADDEDVLSPRALDMGIRRIIQLDKDGEVESLRFSCIALARKL